VVKPEKLKNALYAIHFVLIIGRAMAYNGDETKMIAKLLDWAEILPMMICSTEDETEKFKQYLEAIAGEFPRCSPALKAFDESPPEGW
jgi:hypothetical protein